MPQKPPPLPSRRPSRLDSPIRSSSDVQSRSQSAAKNKNSDRTLAVIVGVLLASLLMLVLLLVGIGIVVGTGMFSKDDDSTVAKKESSDHLPKESEQQPEKERPKEETEEGKESGGAKSGDGESGGKESGGSESGGGKSGGNQSGPGDRQSSGGKSPGGSGSSAGGSGDEAEGKGPGSARGGADSGGAGSGHRGGEESGGNPAGGGSDGEKPSGGSPSGGGAGRGSPGGGSDERAKNDRSADFFGLKAKGDRVVYVLDYSEAMRGELFESVSRGLLKSMRSLEPDQKFIVIVFAKDYYPMFLPREKRLKELVAFTPAIEEQVGEWLEDQVLQTAGDPDAGLALKGALQRYNPTTVFLLASRGIEENAIDEVKRLNTGGAVIHVISEGGRGADSLETLARQNNGDFLKN
jgi:hypothetical protein